ncbi:MAG TPA: DNA polymerase III subunit gamma/tau [Vitreimonas sp.]|nr:DNA polymerase III subunit gamma/tau [Vitreimonas sp.]
MSWYRKYRPTTIAGLHLTTVRETFKKLMSQGQLPQVLLFAGSKGTGKTSTSRILAAMLNDPANEAAVMHNFLLPQAGKAAPYQEPDADNELVKRIQTGNSLVVREMDAASNRGIDDVRQLKEQLVLPPAEGKMVVYILDEVHMLTTEAFNALLKVLEEPPRHVVFILATTEQHKIPATILSRCTIITFAKASTEEISTALKYVLTQEKITFDEAGVMRLAEFAEGSFRDAIKWLELVATKQGEVTLSSVEKEIGGTLAGYLEELIAAILDKDEHRVVKLFGSLRQDNIEVTFFYKQLCGLLHRTLLQALGIEAGKPVVSERVAHFLLQEFLTVSASLVTALPFLALEVKALELVWRAKDKQAAPKSSPPSVKPSPAPYKTEPQPTGRFIASPAEEKLSPSPIPVKNDTTTEMPADFITEPVHPISPDSSIMSDNIIVPSAGDAAVLLSKWQDFLEGVKQRNSSLAAILGSSRPTLGENGSAVIQVFYKFHKDQLQQPKFMKMVQDAIVGLVGEPVNLEFVLATLPAPETIPSASAPVATGVMTGAAQLPPAQDLSALAAEVLV